MKADYFKTIHMILLLEFSLEDVRGFWNRVNHSEVGEVLPEYGFYRMIWGDAGKVPIIYYYRVSACLETFLVERNHTLMDFMWKVPYRSNGSTFAPGSDLLAWFKPVMKIFFFFNRKDPKAIVFELANFFAKNWVEGSIAGILRREEVGDWHHVVGYMMTDATFSEILRVDHHGMIGPLVLASPRLLGLTPLEEADSLCNCILPENFIDASAMEYRDDNLLIHGEIFGRKVEFQDYCARNRLDLSAFHPPNPRVVEMSRDYFCPIRKRTVLFKGSVYGAPMMVSVFKYRKTEGFSENFLAHIIDDLDGDCLLDIKTAGNKHIQLLDLVRDKVVIEYHPEDESISIDGQHVVKGVPAKILRKIVSSHVRDGRKDFEFREFKRDPEITIDPKNSHFEERLNRLVVLLESRLPKKIAIQKTRRGAFAFEATCYVSFKEDARSV